MPTFNATNYSRASRAGGALTCYRGRDQLSPSENISDLLCDLRHWCDREGQDFEAALHRAGYNYHAEVEEANGPSDSISTD